MIVSRGTFIEIGNCKLYHGDALKILPELKDAADLLVVDPPYKLTSGGTGNADGLHTRLGHRPSKDGGEWGSGYQNDGEIVPCDIDWPDFMPPMYGALKAGKQAYIMCNNRHLVNCGNAAEDAGFGFHNWLVWDKGTATPNRWYMKNCEFTGFFYKTPARMINDCGAKQLISCPQVDVSGHPTEKPVALMRHYIEQSTDRGDVVLDSFMGSGTTGVAAVHAGRGFIGIEKDEKYFNMAVQRIMDAVDNFQERLL